MMKDSLKLSKRQHVGLIMVLGIPVGFAIFVETNEPIIGFLFGIIAVGVYLAITRGIWVTKK